MLTINFKGPTGSTFKIYFVVEAAAKNLDSGRMGMSGTWIPEDDIS
jgi:hypothetical protein